MVKERIRIAVATKEKGCLNDVVSDVFGRAATFTLIDVDRIQTKKVKTLQNPAASYKQGAGPVVVKMLVDSGVNVVVAGEFGPGVSTLLEQNNVPKVKVKPSTPVAKAIRSAGLKLRS